MLPENTLSEQMCLDIPTITVLIKEAIVEEPQFQSGVSAVHSSDQDPENSDRRSVVNEQRLSSHA